MKLKLMAPFRVDGLRLNASRVLQDSDGYAAAWDAAAEALGPGLDAVPDLKEDWIESHRCTHASPDREKAGSRYRSIDRHSLSRPLHLLELTLRLSAEGLRARLASPRHKGWIADDPDLAEAADELASALAASTDKARHRALIRVYDHGVAHLELDLPVPAVVLDHARAHRAAPDERSDDAVDTTSLENDGALGRSLDTLQQLGIDLVENLVDEIHDAVLAPLAKWLRANEELSATYLRADASPDHGRTAARTFWVTRSLVFESGTDRLDAPEARAARRAVAAHWLKDVTGSRKVVQSCLDDPATVSTSWLNYLFCEDSYPGHYPADGWRRNEGRAAPFAPAWDALLIAQYYYAAFDQLQSGIARILAISVAGEGRHQVADVKALLDSALRDANMLKLEYDENRKYYARRVGDRVDAILAGWDFEKGLRKQVDARLEDCGRRLDELHARSLEHSSIYTDLILLAIGVTAVFEVLLYLAEYGRTMASDADLAVYDRTSAWNVASWIGASSTDAVLLAGAVFSIGLVCLYAYFRISRSRV